LGKRKSTVGANGFVGCTVRVGKRSRTERRRDVVGRVISTPRNEPRIRAPVCRGQSRTSALSRRQRHLGYQRADDDDAHIGKAEIAALKMVRQFAVVEAQQVENRCLSSLPFRFHLPPAVHVLPLFWDLPITKDDPNEAHGWLNGRRRTADSSERWQRYRNGVEKISTLRSRNSTRSLCKSSEATTDITGLLATSTASRNSGREREGSGDASCLGDAETVM
jgi:hypothetical protein